MVNRKAVIIIVGVYVNDTVLVLNGMTTMLNKKAEISKVSKMDYHGKKDPPHCMNRGQARSS